MNSHSKYSGIKEERHDMCKKINHALIPAGIRVQSSNYNDHIKTLNISREFKNKMFNPEDAIELKSPTVQIIKQKIKVNTNEKIRKVQRGYGFIKPENIKVLDF